MKVDSQSESALTWREIDEHAAYADVGGLRIRYVLAEPLVRRASDRAHDVAARDLVLFHGFGASVFSWRNVIGPLSERHRVLAFDRPGFGLSYRPLPDEWSRDEDDPYTLEAGAEQAVRLMDHVGMREAVLVAHSAGCAVAVATTARFRERVSALVLEAPAVIRTRLAPDWLGPALRSRAARSLGPKVASLVSSLEAESWLRRALHDPQAVTEEVKRGYWEPMHDERWGAGVWECAAAPRKVEASELLTTVRVPVLVIAGRQDAIIPYRSSVDVARHLPDAVLLTYEDTGHVPHEEHPEMFVTDVEAFLAQDRATSL
jgi:pimeloyl-ACP methyl ester carboxylesterase